MDDLLKSIIEERGAWGSRDSEVPRGYADLEHDFAGRLIALLVESAGGRVAVRSDDVTDVPGRLTLSVNATEDGLIVETRRLATGDIGAR